MVRPVAASIAAFCLAACAEGDLEVLPHAPLPDSWDEGSDVDDVDMDADADLGGWRSALVFSQEPLVPDTDVTFTVTGAAPNDTVRFVYSTGGTGAGPCFAGLGGLCLGVLAPANLLGTVMADGLGTAELVFHIPAGAPQIFLFTQAVIDRGANSVATNTITAPVLGGALDNDGDGFCGGPVCADPNALPDDCDDSEPNAFPGQTAYFDVPYASAYGWSFDYDCDSVESVALSDAYQCNPNGGSFFNCPHQDGWDGGVPSCGQVGYLGQGCLEFPLLPVCSPYASSYVAQACR